MQNRDCDFIFPNEILLHIFSLLDIKDLVSINETCKHFNSVSSTNKLWCKFLPGTTSENAKSALIGKNKSQYVMTLLKQMRKAKILIAKKSEKEINIDLVGMSELLTSYEANFSTDHMGYTLNTRIQNLDIKWINNFIPSQSLPMIMLQTGIKIDVILARFNNAQEIEEAKKLLEKIDPDDKAFLFFIVKENEPIPSFLEKNDLHIIYKDDDTLETFYTRLLERIEKMAKALENMNELVNASPRPVRNLK